MIKIFMYGFMFTLIITVLFGGPRRQFYVD